MIIATVVAVLGAAFFALVLIHGHSRDQSWAEGLVQNAESLRLSASDKLSKAALAIDKLVEGAAAGDALPVNQTKTTAESAVSDLSSARDDLSQRAADLDEATKLNLNGNFRHYLALLKSDNDKLEEAMAAAQQITALLQTEQYSLAGWDQAQAQKTVARVHSMEASMDKLFGDSEALYNQAAQLKKDHPDDFG